MIEYITIIAIVYMACTNKLCTSACCNSIQCSSNCTYLPTGDYCTNNASCLSNYCLLNACSDYNANQCTSHSMCASGCCSEKYCLPPVYCSSLKEEGNSCIYNYDCKGDICYKNFCDKNKSGLYSYNINCKNHSECISNCCITLHSNRYCSLPTVCKHFSIGEECFNDFDCSSGSCINEVCSATISSYNANILIFIILPIVSILCSTLGILLTLKFCKSRLLNDMERTPQILTKTTMVCPEAISEGMAEGHTDRQLN